MATKKSTLTWDDALDAFATYLGQATVPQRMEAWNKLQRRASDHAGIAAPGRLPWPDAFLSLTPDDVLDVVTG